MRILVLGGTSFLGRAIVDDALRAGFDTLAWDRARGEPPLFLGFTPTQEHPSWPSSPRPRDTDRVPAKPALIVVSGMPGAGKTTLAHRLAAAVGVPAIGRDAIKEGLVHTASGSRPGHDDALSRTANATFFDVLKTLLAAGVTTVAEAAFQDRLWRPGLLPLQDLARIRVIHCMVDPELALARSLERRTYDPRRRAHSDPAPTESDAYLDRLRAFDRIALPVPLIEADTTNGYRPDLATLAAFATRP